MMHCNVLRQYRAQGPFCRHFHRHLRNIFSAKVLQNQVFGCEVKNLEVALFYDFAVTIRIGIVTFIALYSLALEATPFCTRRVGTERTGAS